MDSFLSTKFGIKNVENQYQRYREVPQRQLSDLTVVSRVPHGTLDIGINRGQAKKIRSDLNQKSGKKVMRSGKPVWDIKLNLPLKYALHQIKLRTHHIGRELFELLHLILHSSQRI